MRFQIFLLKLTTAAMMTVYQSNVHTSTQEIRQIETKQVTLWTTMLHQSKTTDEPTTTIYSTRFATMTLHPFQADVLITHNAKRRLHEDTPDLKWDDAVAASAQAYADEYNCNGTLIHSHNSLYGENLALGYNTTAAVNAWYNEIRLYGYDNPVFAEDTGHFTQVVWKSTTRIGCSFKDCGVFYGQYTVCQYAAPGNWKGLFSTNVEPLA